MNKTRIKNLKQQFFQEHGRYPNKTKANADGTYIPSEWRRLKKAFLQERL